MFDIVFALDREANILVSLEIDETLQAMPFCESLDISRTMFEYPAHEVVGDAHVQDSIGVVCQDVNVAAIAHFPILKGVDGRDKPGHDGIGS
jgi:hypothetical protein